MDTTKYPTIAVLGEESLDSRDVSVVLDVLNGQCNQSKRTKGLANGDCLPGAYNVRQRAHGEIPFWGQQHIDQNDDETSSQDMSQPRECLLVGTDGSDAEPLPDCSIVDAKLTESADNQLLIQGVKMTSQWHRRILLFMGGSIALAVLATIVAIVTTKLLTKSGSRLEHESQSNHANQNTIVPSSLNDTTNNTLFVTSAALKKGNLSWTIADDMANDEGLSLTTVAGGRIFLDLINSTDINFTFFGIQRDANVLDGVDPLLISKLVSPLWSGHAVCISYLDVLSNVEMLAQHIHTLVI